ASPWALLLRPHVRRTRTRARTSARLTQRDVASRPPPVGTASRACRRICHHARWRDQEPLRFHDALRDGGGRSERHRAPEPRAAPSSRRSLHGVVRTVTSRHAAPRRRPTAPPLPLTRKGRVRASGSQGGSHATKRAADMDCLVALVQYI